MQTVGAVIEKIEEVASLPALSFIKKTVELKKIRETRLQAGFDNTLGLMFTKIANLAGLKSQIDDINKQDIRKMILSTFNGLTLPEIYKAFELERYGEYDNKTSHYDLFNAEYVATVLHKYKKWKQSTMILNGIPLGLIEQETEITKDEEKSLMTKAIISRFEHYKATSEINEPFCYLVLELVQRGVIKTASTPKFTEYFEKTYDVAKAQIASETAKEVAETKNQRNTLKEELTRIMNNQSSKVKVRQFKLVLIDFFKKHIDLETDFNEFLGGHLK